ncbi:hypothetical protein F5Y16DRAFT_405563 [Xylariaceae sp. FL0255]|nr:hypothetical protein F5Y16DRAFT_405563 [Xylariaceae sp. FL0255]
MSTSTDTTAPTALTTVTAARSAGQDNAVAVWILSTLCAIVVLCWLSLWIFFVYQFFIRGSGCGSSLRYCFRPSCGGCGSCDCDVKGGTHGGKAGQGDSDGVEMAELCRRHAEDLAAAGGGFKGEIGGGLEALVREGSAGTIVSVGEGEIVEVDDHDKKLKWLLQF